MLKAIETIYKGYRFRSRLEARWAVFFDFCGIEFSYESEGYQFGEIRYLPDFFIPSWDSFVEIKGPSPTDIERKKAELLAINSLKNVYIFSGDCDTQTDFGGLSVIHSFSPYRTDGLEGFEGCFEYSKQDFLVECTFDKRVGLYLTNPCNLTSNPHAYTPRGEVLNLAYTAAKQARFEHGETPIVRH